MHPKSSDGLIKRPRTRILAANGILPAWHSPPIKRVYDPSLSLSPPASAHFPSRDFPPPSRFSAILSL